MKLSPMMQQYMDIKEQYRDCILFFRLGDFYEMFFEDAKLASKELELTLTGKACGQEERAPMCGVPFHAADGYIYARTRGNAPAGVHADARLGRPGCVVRARHSF